MLASLEGTVYNPLYTPKPKGQVMVIDHKEMVRVRFGIMDAARFRMGVWDCLVIVFYCLLWPFLKAAGVFRDIKGS